MTLNDFCRRVFYAREALLGRGLRDLNGVTVRVNRDDYNDLLVGHAVIPDADFERDRIELRLVVEASLRKRLDDWRRSTSEWYAAENGEDAWRDGLIRYLMRGPGALEEVLARTTPPGASDRVTEVEVHKFGPNVVSPRDCVTPPADGGVS